MAVEACGEGATVAAGMGAGGEALAVVIDAGCRMLTSGAVGSRTRTGHDGQPAGGRRRTVAMGSPEATARSATTVRQGNANGDRFAVRASVSHP